MSKKGSKETAVTETPVAEGLQLSDAHKKVLETFSEDDFKLFEAMEDKQKLEMLDFLVQESSVTIDESEFSFDSAEIQNMREEILMIQPNGPLCRPGKTFLVELLGTMPMWSLKKQTGWKDHVAPNGKKFWTSHYYVCMDIKTGKKIGFYRNPVLVKYLTKIPTAASNVNVASNPKLKIGYVGLIEGEERLANEFGIELVNGGEKAHVFTVDVEKGLKFNRYRPGIINYLDNPIPNFGEKEQISEIDRATRDWEQLEMLNNGVSTAAQIEHSPALEAH
jgi:DNA-binding transcriptional ArsR family regulator